MPPGVINVVTTDKNVKEVGDELAQNKVVKKVSFTGSTNVAKLLMQRASSTLKKYGLQVLFSLLFTHPLHPGSHSKQEVMRHSSSLTMLTSIRLSTEPLLPNSEALVKL